MKTRKLWKDQDFIIVDADSAKEKALLKLGWAPASLCQDQTGGIEASSVQSERGAGTKEAPEIAAPENGQSGASAETGKNSRKQRKPGAPDNGEANADS